MSDELPPVGPQPPDRRLVAAVHPACGCDLEVEALRDRGDEPIHRLTLEFQASEGPGRQPVRCAHSSAWDRASQVNGRLASV
jgi:hypothetical protein